MFGWNLRISPEKILYALNLFIRSSGQIQLHESYAASFVHGKFCPLHSIFPLL
jgi:hypothetical protein